MMRGDGTPGRQAPHLSGRSQLSFVPLDQFVKCLLYIMQQQISLAVNHVHPLTRDGGHKGNQTKLKDNTIELIGDSNMARSSWSTPNVSLW